MYLKNITPQDAAKYMDTSIGLLPIKPRGLLNGKSYIYRYIFGNRSRELPEGSLSNSYYTSV